jgi:hypothetical protein
LATGWLLSLQNIYAKNMYKTAFPKSKGSALFFIKAATFDCTVSGEEVVEGE